MLQITKFEYALRWLGFRYSTAGPALTRYYILPHVKLHRIFKSDSEYHNHPWWAVSIIFGSYLELMEDEDDGSCCKFGYKRKFFNIVSPWKRHRVIINKPVWTLFINFRKVNLKGWKYGTNQKPWEGSDQERNGQTSSNKSSSRRN